MILELVSYVEKLAVAFENKVKILAILLKMGRTQLQDAVPMTLGVNSKVLLLT